MIRKVHISAYLAAMVLATLGTYAQAVDLYWDNVAGNGIGGTGTWDVATTSNWNTASTGEDGTLTTWTDGNTAIFGGTAGTVTLTGTVSTKNWVAMQFNSAGYVLTGGNLSATAGNRYIGASRGSSARIESTITFPGGGNILIGSAGGSSGYGDIIIAADNTTTMTGGGWWAYETWGRLVVAHDQALGSRPVLGGNGRWASDANRVFSNGIDLSNTNRFRADSVGSMEFTANFSIGTTTTISNTGTGALTFSGIIAGGTSGNTLYIGENGNTTPDGTGLAENTAVALTNAYNSFAHGSVVVNAQTLRLGNNGAGLPSTANLSLSSNGGLQASGTFQRDFGTAGGQIQITSPYSSYFSAYGGKLTLDLGAAGVSNLNFGQSYFNNLNFGAGNADSEVEFIDNMNLNGLDQQVSARDNPNTVYDFATMSGVISGTGNFLKNGAGLLSLTGSNSYTGKTVLYGGGTLRAVDGVGIPTGSTVELNGGGIWESSSNMVRNYGAPGNISIINGGTSGFSSFNPAGIYIQMGSPTPGTETWGAGSFDLTTLVLNAPTAIGPLEFKNSINLNGANRTINVHANVATITGQLFGKGDGTSALTKGGAGTLVLPQVNSYDGGTTVAAGTLLANGASADAAAKTGNINNGGITISGIDTSGLVVGQVVVNAYLPLSTRITAIGTGTVTLSSAYTGTTGSGTGATFNFTAASSTGSGAVTVQSGAYLGGTGDIVGAVTINDGGFLIPGASIGTLTVKNNVSMASNSTLTIELGAASAADLLRLTGSFTIDDTVSTGTTLALVNAGGAWDGSEYQIITAGTFTQQFATAKVTGLDSGYYLDYSTTNELWLRVLATALLGDLNGDNVVNNQDIAPFVLALTDLATWQSTYPTLDILDVGDINGDNVFNNQDIAPFVTLLTGSGTTLSVSDAGSLNAIPEPATLGLLAIGSLLLGFRGRRRHV